MPLQRLRLLGAPHLNERCPSTDRPQARHRAVESAKTEIRQRIARAAAEPTFHCLGVDCGSLGRKQGRVCLGVLESEEVSAGQILPFTLLLEKNI